MGWDGPSLSVLRVEPEAEAGATLLRRYRVVGTGLSGESTRALLVHADGPGQQVVPCSDLEVGPFDGERTKHSDKLVSATFEAALRDRAPGSYHLVVWNRTTADDAARGLDGSFVFEHALTVP